MRRIILVFTLLLLIFTGIEVKADKPVAGNLNFLPGDEVAGINAQSGRLFDFYRDRTLATNYPMYLPVNETFYSSPVLHNIDNDPYEEIFIISKNDSDEYLLHCFKGTNGEAGGFPRNLDPGVVPAKDFAIGDINGDEIPDIVFGDYEGHRKAYNIITDEELFDEIVSTDYLISPAVFDLDDDGIDEIITVSGEGRINTYRFNFSTWVPYCQEVILSSGSVCSPVLYI